MDLKTFCERYGLKLETVKQEIDAIKKRDKSSDEAAFNEWKRANRGTLSIVKKGKELGALYLFTEHVPARDTEEYKRDESFRLFFLVLPGAEDEPPALAFLKTTKSILAQIFAEEPKAFQGFVFNKAFVTKGDRLNWINAAKDSKGVPLWELKDIEVDNKDIHEMLKYVANPSEDYYDEWQEKEKDYRFNVLCYFHVTDVREFTTKAGKDCVSYTLADNVDQASLLDLELVDWEKELPIFDKYENILVYNGFMKQTLENEDKLVVAWSDKCHIYLARCPTPY